MWARSGCRDAGRRGVRRVDAEGRLLRSLPAIPSVFLLSLSDEAEAVSGQI